MELYDHILSAVILFPTFIGIFPIYYINYEELYLISTYEYLLILIFSNYSYFPNIVNIFDYIVAFMCILLKYISDYYNSIAKQLTNPSSASIFKFTSNNENSNCELSKSLNKLIYDPFYIYPLVFTCVLVTFTYLLAYF